MKDKSAETLPPGWKRVKLGEVAEFIYGDSLPLHTRITGDIAVFGSNGQIGTHNTALTNGQTIIVGRKGSIGEVHYSKNPCWVIDTAYYVKPIIEIDIPYLYHLLKSLELGLLNKASAVPGLNRDDVYAIEIPLPPFPEQKRIADIIQTKFEAVKNLNTLLKTQLAFTTALSPSFLRQAFRGDV
jgi:type I restriction enzyme S subunit